MPRWHDNFVDSVFYLYESRAEADAASNFGACGFLISVPWDHPKASSTARHIYAVSNYHAVIQDRTSIIRLNTKDGLSGVVETDPEEWKWRPGADVAVYRFDGSKHFRADTIWQWAHVYLGEVNFTGEIQREYQIGPGDDVVSVGRFVDIHGIQQNTPLARSGIVASRGEVMIKTDKDKIPWEEEACWMVEMRSRSGFSGSPVYAYIPPWEASFIDAPKRQYGNFFHGPWLLGIHSSQIPGYRDERSAGSGMAAVVPCRKLEDLLVRDEKVRQERAAYEARFIDAPTAEAESASPTKADNPRHKEDFNLLLGEAVVANKEDGQT
jgi:hypothetical protein